MSHYFTPVVVVDAEHLEAELELSIQTWRKYKPQMWEMPWLMVYDRESLQRQRVQMFLDLHGLSHTELLPWPPGGCGSFVSQWEKMVSSLYYACRWVRTAWWMRLDTDAAATGNRRWFSRRWFRSDLVMVGPRFMPIKGPDMRWLDRWGDTLPEFAAYPPQSLEKKAGGWCTFHRTDWTRHCVAIAERHLGRCQIPVAAEDAFFTFCASRFLKSYHVCNMCRMGWLHPRRGRPFREMVEAALRGEYEL